MAEIAASSPQIRSPFWTCAERSQTCCSVWHTWLVVTLWYRGLHLRPQLWSIVMKLWAIQ